ncbi:MAG: TolC family protein [Bacteroidota bacterium]
MHWIRRAIAILAFGLAPLPVLAQTVEPASSGSVTLTLEEAVQVALVNNFALRAARLDVESAGAQIREAWGQVMPQVDATSSYTRNLVTANPFAGSEAGGIFGSLGFVDWLAFNEQARTDGNPETEPIAFDEFMNRRQQGLAEAGAQLGGSSNPFGVDNQFVNGITVSQTIFSGQAFAAIRGARHLREINARGLDRQEQVMIDGVRRAFYQALLAEEQASVSLQSVQRTEATLTEVSRRVDQGVAPKFQRLSAEVELANLETQYMQVSASAETALDQLKMELGIPADVVVQLRGELDAEPVRLVRISAQDAAELAIDRRPDLRQARLAIELRQIDRKMTRAQFYPTLSAFANLNYNGNVPDSRTIVSSNPDDPFVFSTRDRGLFSSDFWDPSVNVGMRLTWNLFNGFQSSAQMQRREVAIRRAEVEFEQLHQAVYLEVQRALRDLETAEQRIRSQEANVARAELNYEFARTRLREGVATPLEERDASSALDTSRLNYLQAVHDYLIARSAFEAAVGSDVSDFSQAQFTTSR